MRIRHVNQFPILWMIVLVLLCGNSIITHAQPNWVQTPPSNNNEYVYFVGKSDKMDNHENYLEAKAGALMDVLTQFSIYKGAEITYIINDNNDLQSITMATRINYLANSAGLYQEDEWMANDGTLYVLYAFSPTGKPIQPDLPGFFKKISLSNNRVYFSAMSVSQNNTGVLSEQAEQNAKMQILLWLGVDINGLLKSYVEESGTIEQSQVLYTFEGALRCISRIDMQNISFREEAKHTQMEQDKKYHYYGLYSISKVKPRNIAGYVCLSYYVEYRNTPQSYNKNINFNGYTFSQSRAYPSWDTGIFLAEPTSRIRDYNHPHPDYIFGMGRAQNPSMEIQNLTAMIYALTGMSVSIVSSMESVLRDYVKDDGDSGVITDVFVTGMDSTSRINTAGCVKIIDELTENGTTWQVWQISKDTVISDLKSELEKAKGAR